MSSNDTNIGSGRSGFATGSTATPPGAGRAGFATGGTAGRADRDQQGNSNSVDPDNVEGLKSSVAAAAPRERTRARERTPNAALNNSGKYPLRTVQEYIGGHRTVFDSTPGARIVEMAHGSGTFQQWSEDGTEIKVIVGNAHQHMKEGYTLTINQNGDIKIDGHCRVSVGGGVHIEAKGDVSLISSGNITTFTPKNYNVVAGGKVNILGRGGVNISTDNNMKFRAEKDHTTKVGKNSITEIGVNSSLKIGEDSKTTIGTNSTTEIGGAATEEVTGAKINRSASAIEDIAGSKLSQAGTMKFEANRIDLN